MKHGRLALSVLTASLVAGSLGAAEKQAPAALVNKAQARVMGMRQALNLDNNHTFDVRRAHTDHLGQTHTRMDQFYKGVRVLGGEVIDHVDTEGTQLGLTKELRAAINLNVNPSLGSVEALAVAHRDLAPIGAYAYEPKAELVIYPEIRQIVRQRPGRAGGEIGAEEVTRQVMRYALAYKVRCTLMNPEVNEVAQWDYVIDAHTGRIIKKWDSLTTADARGTGNSQYNGTTVSLFTNSTASGYELRDVTRGTGGIYTVNMNKTGNTSTGSPELLGTIFTDSDNVWGDGLNYNETSATTSANGQTAAVDAHYAMQVTWDLLKNVYGRNGLDGTGKAVYSRVHFGSAFDNAFWIDSCFCMTYGDGTSFKTLTSMDVGAHEMAHGLCANSANLDYSGEAGGLNEANSDIIGALGELYARSGATGNALPATATNTNAMWTIGEQLASSPLRWMYKPSKDGGSKDAWSSTLGSLDPHYSSGPGNRMFFFLSQGASATSGDYYSSYTPNGFTGIGPDKAGRIWYRALVTYMTSTTTFAQARTACINSARDLYGANSVEEAAVWNAFAAINVGAAWSGGTSTDTVLPTVSASETGTSGTITFSATASDNVGVTKVEFYVDGVLKGTDTSSPYSMTLDSTTLTNASHALVAKAYDAAGNVGTSTSVTFTISNSTTPPPTGSNLLVNGGFESGAASWTGTTAVIGTFTAIPAFEGVQNALFGGKGVTTSQSLYQAVAIPSNATTASLSFQLRITSAETTTSTAYDKLTVQVRNSAGTSLATLATYSNLNKNTAYALKTFDLAAYKGQTVQIYFSATEDSSLQTSFAVDAVTLATDGTSTADTTAPAVSVTETGTSGTITLAATATDNVGVSKVEFYVDGVLKGTDTTSPYSMTLDSTTLANGTHTLTAKAYDAAGNIGNATAISFSVNNTTPTTSDLILNGGFESGATNWTGTTASIGTFTGQTAYEGTKYAWLCGNGTTATEYVYQTVTIPSTATSATLSFYLHIDTAETTTATQYDKMTVTLRNTAGTTLTTLATYSNLNKATGYAQKTFDVTAYKGQTVRVYFNGTEDSSLQTSFVLDKVALVVR